MEKDTVLLAVDKYNELRDFKKEIEKGNTAYGYSGYSTKTFVTSDEAVKSVLKLNEDLNKQLEYYKEHTRKLQDELKGENKPKEISIEEIKKMSTWQFRKWKKTQL